MLIFSKKIIGLKVESKSKQDLGVVRDFNINTENFEIFKIYVRPSGLLRGLVSGDLIIGKSAIISIDEEKMVVEDLTEGELAREKKASSKIAMQNSPVSAVNLE